MTGSAHTASATSGHNGVITELAELPPDAHVDASALARILGRSKKAVQRAVRRRELPAPFWFLGKHTWLVKTITDHFNALQRKALKEARQCDEQVERLTS